MLTSEVKDSTAVSPTDPALFGTNFPYFIAVPCPQTLETKALCPILGTEADIVHNHDMRPDHGGNSPENARRDECRSEMTLPMYVVRTSLTCAKWRKQWCQCLVVELRRLE